MKTKFVTFVCIAFFGLSSILFAQKSTLGGVSIPKTYSLNGKTLVLNGSAVREKYFMDIYVGSLYLQSKNKNGKSIINSEGDDMAFRLKIVSKLLSSKKMRDGIKESFGKVAKEYPVNPKVFEEFLTLFDQKIEKGDEFWVTYSPEQGLTVIKNGKKNRSIKDVPLKKAMFATWLANAISEEFTSNVLNGN